MNRRDPKDRICLDCRCYIDRGLRCGPCRDIADENRRQAAYALKKAGGEKADVFRE
jgi:hypothetical protein